MLVGNRLRREDSSNNSWQEEGGAGNRNTTEKEDSRRRQYNGVEDAATDFLPAKRIDKLSGSNSFGFKTSNGELFLVLSKPKCRLRAIREDKETYYAKDDSCSTSKRQICQMRPVGTCVKVESVALTFNSKNHPPCVQAAKIVEP